MDFRLLGALEVSAGEVAADLGPPKQRALLAILLLHAEEIVPIDRLIELLWGDSPPRTAEHSVQIYVSNLRKAFEGLGANGILSTRAPGYQLDARADSIDIRQFEAHVREGTRKLRDGDLDGGAGYLQAALRLWRGPALSDFAYEEFAQPYIRRLHDLHLDAIEELAAADLEGGHSADAVAMLDAAIREDPLRERSRELLMLGLYRTGRHPEALRTYQHLRTLLNEELGLEPSPPLQRLQERILLHDPALMPPDAAATAAAAARNPYKGLHAFGERDAPDFFGREDLVTKLLRSLRDDGNLVALVGPSGSGKSSVIAAGVISRLREGAIDGSDAWLIAQMTPGTNPLAEVEAVIAAATGTRNGLDQPLDAKAGPRRRPTQTLLVIDQFEEVFTLTEEPQRQQLLDALVEVASEPDTPIRVLLALRADYYDHPLHHAGFARLFTPNVVNVLPMTPEELEAAIVGPAEKAGVVVEPALLAELVGDAAHRPATLPLLEYALTELFDRRAKTALTLDGYRAVGGIRGVLSRRAETIYEALSPPARQITQQLFLRLVQLGRGATESRRRLALTELMSLDLDPVALSQVLDDFGQRRLLTFDRDPATDQATVEVAHESLFREWTRLAGWIDGHRAALVRFETFTSAADEWEASGRHADYLLMGTRLAEFEAWSAEGTLPFTGRLREYLEAGVARREAEEAAARAQFELERRLEFVRGGVARRWRPSTPVQSVGSNLARRAGGLTDVKRVTLVRPGAGDLSALSEAGFDRAVAEFGLVGEEILYEDSVGGRDAIKAELMQLAGAGTDLAIVTSGTIRVEDLAAARPDVFWVSTYPVADVANVAYFDFLDNEGAYLAGVAAAHKTKTGMIGFIGGADRGVIWQFHAGYVAGARSVDPEIEVPFMYLADGDDFSGFYNADAAEDAARGMYEQGADVIFAAAGHSGVGLFEAATALSTPELHLWAIGVDTDQYESVLELSGAVHVEAWRRHILTSVLKRVDVANYEIVKDFAHGHFTLGSRTFNVANGGLDLSFSGGHLEEVRGGVEAARADIVSGRVVVPTRPAERATLTETSGWFL
ncbi:MAG TPA: BTAD domain-containing putative transcriptional regulator [Candidatus Limnocylindrales bacterium]|nr:BTAD domain-containing putative transcriptional regulator [Candidatus Limnocylindrales bacterium]